MQKILFVGALCLAAAGCASPQQAAGTATGAAAGAVVGGPVGAAVGAGVGAAVTAPQPSQTQVTPARRRTR